MDIWLRYSKYTISKRLLIIGIVLFILGGIGIQYIVHTNQSALNTNWEGDTMRIPQTFNVPDQTTGGGLQQETGNSYVDYSAEAFSNASGKKRVLFFHASWCPTCKVAHAEFERNPAGISPGVIVFKTDYDANADLKKKYGITYQHTFVQVDDQGNEVAKWNGGGIKELVANVK